MSKAQKNQIEDANRPWKGEGGKDGQGLPINDTRTSGKRNNAKNEIATIRESVKNFYRIRGWRGRGSGPGLETEKTWVRVRGIQET